MELKENAILSGFVNVQDVKGGEFDFFKVYLNDTHTHFDLDSIFISFSTELICEKPNYEVGSSAKLSFAKTAAKPAVASVWKIDNDDDEIINPDDLLDEEDKIKPDPASLKGN